MLKYLAVSLAFVAVPVLAEDLPQAITCYQDSAHAKDIEAFMACFIQDAQMIDVSRSFNGQDTIRGWALREVIPSGDTFAHREILEQDEGYAKTEVNWLSWVVHYSYWWDAEGKITRMSLQYAN